MARRFGKKKEIKIDMLDYNLGLIGISGVGKSTLAKEVCEELVGENGYLAIDMSRENGHDAIANIVSETAADWDYFCEITDDIIDNRNTDYKDLKIIIYDTIDDLFELAEKEVIRLSNRKNPTNKTDSVNGAFGGFGRGQDKAIELVVNKLWELKELGIGIFVIGHTKVKSVSDPMTGQDYEMLTTNIPMKYFNAIKNKLHVLGVASIERDIKSVKTGKNSFTGKENVKGVIENEKRIISFRDDSYNIDSKSRFAEITPKIPLNATAFIEAIQGAIKLEYDKQNSKKSIEETAREQDIQKEKDIEDSHKKIKEDAEKTRCEVVVQDIMAAIEKNKSTPTKLKPFTTKFKEMGFVKIDEINNVTLEQAQELLALIK